MTVNRELDNPPLELMIVEDDNSTDPYNSGLHRRLKMTDVVFLRDGKTQVGDTTTEVEDFYSGRTATW